jgi:hypothetical protein
MKTSHVVALVVVAGLLLWFASMGKRLAGQLSRPKVLGLPPVGRRQQLDSSLAPISRAMESFPYQRA